MLEQVNFLYLLMENIENTQDLVAGLLFIASFYVVTYGIYSVNNNNRRRRRNAVRARIIRNVQDGLRGALPDAPGTQNIDKTPNNR